MTHAYFRSTVVAHSTVPEEQEFELLRVLFRARVFGD